MDSVPEVVLAVEGILTHLGIKYRLQGVKGGWPFRKTIKYDNIDWNEFRPQILTYPPEERPENPADDWEDSFGDNSLLSIFFAGSAVEIKGTTHKTHALIAPLYIDGVSARYAFNYPFSTFGKDPIAFLDEVAEAIRSYHLHFMPYVKKMLAQELFKILRESKWPDQK